MFSHRIRQKLHILSKFCTVIKPTTRNLETLEPVKLSYATYENKKTNHDIPPLVIMHGLFGAKQNWNSLCKVYQERTNPCRKVFAVDARNHGDSPHTDEHTYAHLVADLKAFLEEHSIEKATFLGHSMGGRAVMLLALKYPELVEKLVVGDISPIRTSPNLYELPDLFRSLENVNLPKDVPMSKARSNVDEQLSKYVPNKGLRAFLITNLVQNSNGSYEWRINIPSLLDNFNNVARFPTTTDLKYEGPTLFVGGANSNYIHRDDYPEILKLFPNAKLHFIDGAGHWIHAEKPNDFLKLTLDFLNDANWR